MASYEFQRAFSFISLIAVLLLHSAPITAQNFIGTFPFGVRAPFSQHYRTDAPDAFVVQSYIGSPLVDGPGANANLWHVMGITSDNTSLYIADTYNRAVRKIDASGLPECLSIICVVYVTTLAGTGKQGLDNGPGDTAAFDSPRALLYVRQLNAVLVSETAVNCIRMVSLGPGIRLHEVC